MYATDKENYEKEIKKTVKNLKRGIPAMNKMFKDKDFNILLEDLEKYNSNVKQDYEDFQHVQVVWKKLKKTIEIAEKMCYNRVKRIILTS